MRNERASAVILRGRSNPSHDRRGLPPRHHDMPNHPPTTAADFKRILYVSAFPPSDVSGSAVIMRDLLAEIPADRMELVVSAAQERLAVGSAACPSPWRVHAISLPPLHRHVRFLAPVLALGRALCIPLIAVRVAIAARRSSTDAILAIQDSGEFLTAAWLAARLLRIELMVYMTDDWESAASTTGRIPSFVARRVLPRLARHSSRRWLISEAMQAEWRDRFGVDSEVLTHSVDLERFQPPRPPTTDRLRIICVGSIYSVNAAPIEDFACAVEQLRAESVDVSLEVFAANPSDRVKDRLERRDGVTLTRVDPDLLPLALSQADAALIALSFDQEFRRVAQVAYPTKLAEYLAAGLPVIVYAPSDATAARTVTDANCGVTIGNHGSEFIVPSLLHLLENPHVRAAMSKHALKFAEEHHDLNETRKRFYAHLSI